MSNLNIEDIINETTGKNNIMLKYAETCLKECEPGSDNYNKALKIINSLKHNDPKFKDLKQDMKSFQLGMVKAGRKLADQHNEKTASESAPIHNKINNRVQNESTADILADIDYLLNESSGRNGFDARLAEERYKNSRIDDPMSSTYGDIAKAYLKVKEDNKHSKTKTGEAIANVAKKNIDAINDKNKVSEIHNKINNRVQNESTSDILNDIDYLLNEFNNLYGDEPYILNESSIGAKILKIIVLPYVIAIGFASIFSIIDGIKSKMKKDTFRKGKNYIEFNKILNYKNINEFVSSISAVRYDKNVIAWMDEYIKYKNFEFDKIEQVLKTFKAESNNGTTGDYDFMDAILKKYGNQISAMLKGFKEPSTNILNKNKDTWVIEENPTAFKAKLAAYFNNLNKLHTRSENIFETITAIEENLHKYHDGYEYGDIYEISAFRNLYHELLTDSGSCGEDEVFKYIDVKGSKK